MDEYSRMLGEIPKVIHYCWFGRGKLPRLARRCIASWQKYLPEYKIVEWNEDNFDINITHYTSQAYQEKRYAFVSDYARYWVLYNYGGIYFDTDVEIIAPMGDIISKGAFMGCETVASHDFPLYVAPGLGMGLPKGCLLCKEMLEIYSSLLFIDKFGKTNLKTIVQYTTEYLVSRGLDKVDDIQCVDGIWIYPKEYFNPYDYDSEKLNVTPFTKTIHHFSGSWLTPKEKMMRYIEKKCGERFVNHMVNIIKFLKQR